MSTPLFGDFKKKVKDLFKRDNYDLGNCLEAKNTSGDAKWKGSVKIKNGTVIPKLTAETSTDFAKFEVVECMQNGLSLEVTKNNAYKNIDLKLKGTDGGCFDIEATYAPQSSFWNTKFVGGYVASRKNGGGRLCSSKLSGAVGDDSLGLSVGAEVTVEDQNNPNTGSNMDISNYSLAFLYEPVDNSSYCVSFCPQDTGTGLNYSLSCWRKYSDKCQIAARADGRADIQLLNSEAPTLTLAGEFGFDNAKMTSFWNTHREWGVNYKFNVSKSLAAQISVCNLMASSSIVTKMGYKLTLQ